ncbi:MAG: acetyl-CoA hydrolase/transferase family protein [Bacilli bacterium]
MDIKNIRYTSIQDVYALLCDDDDIVVGMMGAEPQLFLQQLHTVFPKLHHLRITNCLPMGQYPIYTDPQLAKHVQIDTWFLSPVLRKAYSNGNISFVPNHLHMAAVRLLQTRKPRVYVGAASMPDANGNLTLSLSNVYEKRILEAADLVILEVNPNYPKTYGDTTIALKDVDYLVAADYPVPELKDVPISEKDAMIGRYIAEQIPDGACLQLGIGAIPNAVANALVNKKDLGVHTEMLTTGFLKLYQAGAITNQKKQLHRGKFVCAFVAGDHSLYQFINNNPDVLIMDAHYTNHPEVIAQNDHQISINATMEIDLTGQCCSESIGSQQYSGTGGQSDTANGATRSKGGKSFITLHATATIKDPITHQPREISKIVPQLKPGAIVSLSRNDVDHVVTEYGIASLRGANVAERVTRLIAIAHPQFRESLLLDAKRLGLI